MPFVRFSRDKRGYEHVYLIDAPADRGRSRILYWFRTPPGVKVGRMPFDPETQRTLERQNPGVRFDWPQIVAAKIPLPAPIESWREKRRIERAIKRARAEESSEQAAVPSAGDQAEEPAEATPSDEVGSGQRQRAANEGPAVTATGDSQRRRRRRRGRRRAESPAAPPDAQNEVLDPPDSPGDTSNEG